MKYEFTNSWFEQSAQGIWDQMFPEHIKPKKILEIGSYEGKSLCYLIDKVGPLHPLEIHAVDSWFGGEDHVSKLISEKHHMSMVEERFHKNVGRAINDCINKVDLHIHKGLSEDMLCKLVTEGFKEYFDFIYVDGSHGTLDTLSDLVLSYKLLKQGGLLIVDDYLWRVSHNDPDFRPKLAIDAFTNLILSKIEFAKASNAQVYFFKKEMHVRESVSSRGEKIEDTNGDTLPRA